MTPPVLLGPDADRPDASSWPIGTRYACADTVDVFIVCDHLFDVVGEIGVICRYLLSDETIPLALAVEIARGTDDPVLGAWRRSEDGHGMCWILQYARYEGVPDGRRWAPLLNPRGSDPELAGRVRKLFPVPPTLARLLEIKKQKIEEDP